MNIDNGIIYCWIKQARLPWMSTSISIYWHKFIKQGWSCSRLRIGIIGCRYNCRISLMRNRWSVIKLGLLFRIWRKKLLEKLHIVDLICPSSLIKYKNGRIGRLKSLRNFKISDWKFLGHGIHWIKIKKFSRKKSNWLRGFIWSISNN